MAAELEDPLLKELNGAMAKVVLPEPTLLDKPGAQPPSLEDQLQTRTASEVAARTPRAELLDKTHSKAAGGSGYRVIVEGEYYAKGTETKGHIVKSYKLPFNLRELKNAKGEAALGIIVGKLLRPALKKFDAAAVNYRTHTIVLVETLNGAPPPTGLQYMNFESLKAWVRQNEPGFPIDVDEYWMVEHLREDVIDFKTNAENGGFGSKKSPAERIKERHAVRKEDRELAAMNEGLELEAKP